MKFLLLILTLITVIVSFTQAASEPEDSPNSLYLI